MPQKQESNLRRRWSGRIFGKDYWRGLKESLRTPKPQSFKDEPLTDDKVLNQIVPKSSMTTKKKTSAKKPTKAKKVAKKVAKKTTKKAPAKKAVTSKKKSAAKKTTTKKTAAKKVSTKGKKLVLAKGAKCFWVNKGPILRDLVGLEKALNDMTETMFKHHVGGSRNDFADWVEGVLKDKDTAAALRKAKKPHTARKVVVSQLELYYISKK